MTRQNVRCYTYDAAALFTTSTYSAMDKYTFSPSAPRTFPALNIVVPRARSNTTRRERRGRDADEERGVLRDVFDRIPVESECIKPAESSSTFSSDAAISRRFFVAPSLEEKKTRHPRRRASRRKASTDREARARPPRRRPRRPR